MNARTRCNRLRLKPLEARRWRSFAMIKQSAMAHRLGLTQGGLSRIETGSNTVDARRAECMVDLINRSLEEAGIDARCTVSTLAAPPPEVRP